MHLILQNEQLDVRYLLTTVSRKFERVSQHGVSLALLEKQAESIGIPLKKVWLPETLNMQSYSATMRRVWHELKDENIQRAIFGDIYLDRLRQYRENQLKEVGISADFPLWEKNTAELGVQFINKGFKAVVVCVNTNWLDKSFVGRMYDRQFLQDLPDDVDPCGEQGEFHTFVFDGPIFKNPISWKKGKVVFKETPKENARKKPTRYQVCGSEASGSEITGSWFCALKSSH